ncbi:MAG: aspartate aminotransferase family protein [Bacteroidales bacterium]|jgi:acetylornithine/succinyldiaminopimelate/putrescine aminotransferase|nr:aspartate aminotransferase family protein [Bacteroidales bacterium]
MNSTALFKRYLAQTSNFTPFIVDVERAEGVYIWDKSEKKYLDFTSGMCANNLGNRHPKVIAAIENQLQKFSHTMVYGEFIQQPQIDFAEKICSLLPENLQQLFYVNSGSEAIEGAIKLARLNNSRSEIISFKNAYHGSTMGAMSVLGNESYRTLFRPILPDTKLLEFNNISQLSEITEKTCCVITEVIRSGAGMELPNLAFIQALRNRCNETGALLIFDEIQTGFGRTGKLFAFEHYNIAPDILCIAKSMGGGMPIGAFVSSIARMNRLNNGHPLLGHATTFGGHPVSCAAGLASLEIISNPEFLEQVNRNETLIRNYFQHPEIKEIRGKGQFLAVELNNPKKIEDVVTHCVNNGLLLLWLLFNYQSLALTPPLIITEEQIKDAAEIFKTALNTCDN